VLKGFILGIVTVCLIAVAGTYWFVTSGSMSAGQDAGPLRLERWAAKKSLRATMRREARDLKSPLQPDTGNLQNGAVLYVQHCQVCHGGPSGMDSAIAKGLSPKAPQLAKHGVEDDLEGTIYWKTAHGIRFTGMPGFRESLSEQEIWQVSLFLKRMDSSEAQNAWTSAGAREKANP
jgi:mono/diheme cytochrome c family protein